jgi:hypothetical protein
LADQKVPETEVLVTARVVHRVVLGAGFLLGTRLHLPIDNALQNRLSKHHAVQEVQEVTLPADERQHQSVQFLTQTSLIVDTLYILHLYAVNFIK